MEKPYWTVPEVALALKASFMTIQKRIATGQIRAQVQRGEVLVPGSEVDRLMREAAKPSRSTQPRDR